MLYFPSNIDPLFVDGTTHSCITARTYCAYHSSFQQGNVLVRFGVMPDVNANGCAGGCGNGQPFDNLTLVSSHELIEAVTDPDNNTAWVDKVGACNPSGEIGDICATGGASEVGSIASFTVQKEWSNTLNSCVVSNPNIVVNDFNVAASPTTVNVPQGGMASVTLTLTKVSGNAENVALTTAAPPTGITASFNPASVTSANGTSTVTITAGPSAMLGMAKITVKAAGTAVSKSQDVPINVVPPPDMAMTPTGGGGSGGSGGGGSGGAGSGGSGGSGGNGASGGGATSGCSIGGAEIGGGWAFGALLLLALAVRRRRA
jgi:MYXO-CTERM domain-containing protein